MSLPGNGFIYFKVKTGIRDEFFIGEEDDMTALLTSLTLIFYLFNQAEIVLTALEFREHFV